MIIPIFIRDVYGLQSGKQNELYAMSDPEYPPGKHPASLQNLAKTSRPGRSQSYGEAKKTREVSITETGWEGVKTLAHELNCKSVSELIERLGRRELHITEE
ncbi:MAG: hypothetical protein KME15_20070 [Drouetiella hepatica Uher 2000/2452]|uniref:Uncharacterized protein n=1 Tax=Drouetiella hepatica Uher 2000/2452 TaxID=904376 RepID=A0A951UPM1_9CYAN|nr:hypothetical protein [Drouetiella hepatica Uher 2000/2452]